MSSAFSRVLWAFVAGRFWRRRPCHAPSFVAADFLAASRRLCRAFRCGFGCILALSSSLTSCDVFRRLAGGLARRSTFPPCGRLSHCAPQHRSGRRFRSRLTGFSARFDGSSGFPTLGGFVSRRHTRHTPLSPRVGDGADLATPPVCPPRLKRPWRQTAGTKLAKAQSAD